MGDKALTRLEAEHHIQRAYYEYARALDMRDWPALDRVFTQDCDARYGADAHLQGREAIVSAIRRYLDNCGPSQHMISNIVVDADGDCLVSHAAVRAIHRARDDNRVFESVARYSGRWIADQQGWRACVWRMDVGFNHGDPTVLGLPASADVVQDEGDGS
ncbi:nuclear transport factor 2 family protein [Sphingobium sp. WCS2017Hpa-17]|uniref:nuclear transport factor 2 family protein n=1 Tax=Sphingobium sp. WCS2017Hpa-17 TaxID=3073638 RepID=UPI00288A0B07|nr:nuclear transport factor 2 family protein [Sphingobium sp. WCS2017Hpa-17]